VLHCETQLDFQTCHAITSGLSQLDVLSAICAAVHCVQSSNIGCVNNTVPQNTFLYNIKSNDNVLQFIAKSFKDITADIVLDELLQRALKATKRDEAFSVVFHFSTACHQYAIRSKLEANATAVLPLSTPTPLSTFRRTPWLRRHICDLETAEQLIPGCVSHGNHDLLFRGTVMQAVRTFVAVNPAWCPAHFVHVCILFPCELLFLQFDEFMEMHPQSSWTPSVRNSLTRWRMRGSEDQAFGHLHWQVLPKLLASLLKSPRHLLEYFKDQLQGKSPVWQELSVEVRSAATSGWLHTTHLFVAPASQRTTKQGIKKRKKMSDGNIDLRQKIARLLNLLVWWRVPCTSVVLAVLAPLPAPLRLLLARDRGRQKSRQLESSFPVLALESQVHACNVMPHVQSRLF